MITLERGHAREQEFGVPVSCLVGVLPGKPAYKMFAVETRVVDSADRIPKTRMSRWSVHATDFAFGVKAPDFCSLFHHGLAKYSSCEIAEARVSSPALCEYNAIELRGKKPTRR